MKFSRYIQFNAVPEWSENYLPYSKLKTLIYMIEKEKKASLNEYTTLLPTNQEDHVTFTKALDDALTKIIQFYTDKENEANSELDHLLSKPVANVIQTELLTIPSSSSIDIEDNRSFSTSMTLNQNTQLIDLYIYLCKLKSFVSLNMTAFTKILKKYDKVMNARQSQSYMFRHILEAYPFQAHTRDHLDDLIQQVEQIYSNDKKDKNDLAVLLAEQVTHDRNVIWRERLGQERKLNNLLTSETTAASIDQLRSVLIGVLSLAVFVYLLNSSLFEHIEQRRCFAVLVFASILWATELMPLFVTALLVPFLVIVLRVIRSQDETDEGKIIYTRLSTMEASKMVFGSMLSPVIMLLLGGFTIAAALNKYGIAKALASFVLSKAGTRPSRVLIVNMLVASMASMWISNVASPVLCLSLIQPILRNLPEGSSFGPCLIMGIALASNLGGIASPIASPQNVIAIQNMSPPPSWADWFCVSIPLCLLGNCLVCLWLLKSYGIKDQDQISKTTTTNTNNNKITGTQMYISCVTLFTIILWCIAHTYRDTLGDMGVIAIIPLIAFFGSGLLTKDEFNGFLWNVIILAMGGIALGKAVDSSGLLHTIAIHISERVMGLSTFQVLFVFSSLVLVIATFISHTVAALIVLPIVAKIGAQLPDPNPRLLVMGTAFVCSAAMGLPVSGFPNMTAISQENSLGVPYLKTKDFLRNGVPCSILIMLCIVTLGYVLMELTGI